MEKKYYKKKKQRADYHHVFKSNDIKYRISALSYHSTSKNEYMCNTIYVDWYIEQDFFNKFNVENTPIEQLSKTIDIFMSKMKKDIELRQKDYLVVFNYPNSFTSKKQINKSGIMVSLCIYIEPEICEPKFLKNKMNIINEAINLINQTIYYQFETF